MIGIGSTVLMTVTRTEYDPAFALGPGAVSIILGGVDALMRSMLK
jgi:hypothetical protein